MTVMKDDPKPMTLEPGEALAGMPEEVKNEPLGPMIGVAAIALNMALKYHDINTVQDGALYQQYKLEGRNMRNLQLEYVFDTALRIEEHLINANQRVAKLLVASVLLEDDSEGEPEASEETEVPPSGGSDSQ